MLRHVVFGLGFGLILASSALSADVAKDKEKEAPKPPLIVDLTLKGSISEDPAPVGIEGAPIKDNLKGIVDKLAKAKNDDAVKGLVLRIQSLELGWARVNELRKAIRNFRDSGKRVVAYLEDGGNAEYAIAAAADEVVMPESGSLMIKGLAAEITFYKSLFDKLGVVADWMQVGEFKSYGEPYTRTKMSPAFREEMTSILGDTHALLAEVIAERQGITVDDAKALIDNGPYRPKDAKAAGLVNRIAYEDQIEAGFKSSLKVAEVKLDAKYGKKTEQVDMSGLAGFLKMMQALSGEGPKKAASKNDKIALIYCSGAINTGKSSGSSLLGEATMGSETVIKHLREAEADKTVKAIVLRVDSPGGSALASDLIWREVVRIEKPIVASMGDVAASGGYYISMGADKVFAEPGTITGSIGVTGGKFVLGGLMSKVGIDTDTITVGKNGTIFSMSTPFSPTEKAAMQKMMDETYTQFVTKAAQGRKMPVDKLKKLAGGRVYTGRQANSLGLVDSLGTLNDAIASAKDLAGISPTKDMELLILPKPMGVLESLLGPLEDRDVSVQAVAPLLSLAPEAARSALARVELFRTLLRREPVVLMMPFDIKIR